MLHQSPEMIRNTLRFADRTNPGGVSEHFFILTTMTAVSYLSSDKLSYKNYDDIFDEYKTKNFCYINTSFGLLKKIYLIKRNDKLILHGCFAIFRKNDFFWLFLYFCSVSFRKRIVLIFWNGGEFELKNRKRFYSFALNLIKKNVFSTVRFLVTLSIEDQRRAKKIYPKANILATTIIIDNYTLFNSYKTNNKNKKFKKIMISHSAFEHNNHLRAFGLLEKFKNEKIQIICPLCYGNRSYQKNIIEKGKELFGTNFIYYQELLPLPQYNSLLATLDVYVSLSYIQTGLHVIYFGLCTGLKIYLTGNNLSSVKELGFAVNSAEELEHISFKQFTTPLSHDKLLLNDTLAQKHFGAVDKVEIWRTIYEASI